MSTNSTLGSHLLAFSLASLRSVLSMSSSCGQYAIHILERPAVVFPPLSHTPSFSVSTKTASGNIPTVEEWVNLWRAWDMVTLQMIPQEMLHQKPIDLRHKCLFYIGHIPTFLDMLATGRPWDTIMEFRTGVRARLLQLYDDLSNGKQPLTRNIARTLVMTHEHEGFHVETLLYMLIQRAGTGTLPPAGFVAPPWDLLKLQWDATPPPSTDACREYGWDNESPARQVAVGKFKAAWRPVTNKEFLPFWRAGKAELPRSWVRTVYGPVPMDIAAEWPELRLFLNTYDVGYERGANIGLRNWHPVPATTGLENEGGRGSNGGIWEWTTTVFDNHDGLVPTNLFTGYSTDFFDTKHQTVLGASYATIPRLGRETLRNFWQRGYGYAWVGGRIVWDI
ncbi:C-type lectin protein [Mycena filopes]|nr:C-type lectin protein [Mycena filopes]